MFKKFRVMTVVALAAFALTVSVGGLIAADDKVPTVSEIMKVGHAGGKSLIAKTKAAVKAEKWDEAKVPADALKVFGEALGKNKPEKGDAESWKKLADKYKASTAAAAAAVEKKDAKAVGEALGKIGTSCKECHDAHK
jgi:cytochrome c556